MRILFLHQNFPGQFPHLANYLQAQGHQVLAIQQPHARGLAGVQSVVYQPARKITHGIHHYIAGLESAVLNGQATVKVMQGLKQRGFTPDVVIGHAGWGETLYVKDVFPNAKLINYFEFFYHATGADTDFDPEFPNTPDDVLRIRTKNSTHLLALTSTDVGISPTQWQKSQFPAEFQPKISVIHEGIDSDFSKPDHNAQFTLPNGKVLTGQNKVVTFVSRNLEPYRGFHQFMRALPSICQRHPDCDVLIVGSDDISYGRRPQDAENWRQQMLAEVEINPAQVHFLGRLSHADFTKMLQISSAHVYLTVPFVLSWSMLEAMAVECLVIGSSTAPVLEVLNEERGLLVDFFSPEDIAEKVDAALTHPDKYKKLRQAARRYVLQEYNIEKSLKQYAKWIKA